MQVRRVRANRAFEGLLDGLAPQIFPNRADQADWCRVYLSRHRNRFLEDLQLADELTPPGWRIVDVGASPPMMTAALTSTGRHVVGLDIDPSRFSRCIEGMRLDVRACDVERDAWPIGDGEADAIIMNEVFEHLHIDPIRVMGEVLRVLHRGGLLLLSTPNLASYRGYLNLLLRKHAWAVAGDPYEEFGKLRWLGHMGHVREYTSREVTEFLARCNLHPTQVIFRGMPKGWKEAAATRIFPSLLPYISVVAEKPGI